MTKTKKKSERRLPHRDADLQLQGVRLTEAHCKLGTLKKNELPTQAAQEAKAGFQIDAKAKAVKALASYRLTVAYPDSKEGEHAVLISASFGLRYALESKPRDPESIEEAIHRSAIVASWPFWREFVFSMLSRMGLPAFSLQPLVPSELKGVANA
jgi:hypothetical protein